MVQVLTKYLVLIGASMFIFTNFIACGSQMYKVSVAEDHDKAMIPESAANVESHSYGIHAINGWNELPIKFRIGKTLTPSQEEGLERAMKTWERAVGTKLFEKIGRDDKDGDYFKDLYSSLPDMVNGHYLDTNWQKTGKPDVVIATTIWDNYIAGTIETADIRFNNYHYLIHDAYDYKYFTSKADERDIVDMETLALHELGHLLGLAHVAEEVDGNSIMNPTLFVGEGLANRVPSYGDIQRIQQVYQCEGNACDIDSLVLAFEQNRKEYFESPSIAEEESEETTPAH